MIDKKILLPHQYYYPGIHLGNNRATKEMRSEMLESLSDSKREVLLYIHFPFCDSHCAFCGFNKHYELNDIDGYVAHLKEELKFYSQYPIKINNIHFGGGTPTLVPGKMLTSLVDFVKEHFECSENLDFNIEGSATSLYREDIVEFIRESNVTRVSVGIQTFNPGMREVFKTQATLDEVYKTLDTLKTNNIDVFTDILFGYPDFGLELKPEQITKNDITEAMRLGVAGIDFSQIFPYSNQLEKVVKDNNLSFPTSEQIVNHMTECMDYMEDNGYHQETSYGFVKRGRIIMETSYYGGEEPVSDTLAIGCSAFGLLNGYKYMNPMYSGYMRMEVPSFMQIKKLSDKEKEFMNIVSFSKLLVLSKKMLDQNVYRDMFKAKLDKLIEMGYVQEEESCYRVTKLGRLYVDNIYYYMLDDAEREFVDTQVSKVVYK